MSIRNNYPTVNPTLDLDFANTRRLDPRVTFTRSSTATYYDGSKALAEQNLLLNSQTFNTTWVASSITFATGITDPLGTTTAYTATASGANATVYQSVIIPADTFTFSIYIQRVTGTGTINLTLNGTTMTVASVTGSWVRYTATQALTAGTYTVGIKIVTSGDAVNIWGAQLEQRSSASAYNVTTTSIVANYISVLKTAAINQPRFDVDPVTGESKGLLIEESKTNLLTYSSEFDNSAVWTRGVGLTVTPNTAISPDGSQNADTITANGSASTASIYYDNITVTASTSYTFSIYVKLGTLAASDYKIAVYNVTGSAFIAIDATPTQVPNSTGWTRISYTFTTPVGCISARVYPYRNSTPVTNATMYLYGAQVEAGAFPTSYIPTTSAQVTRTADNARMTGTAFSSWYNQSEGTVAAEYDIVSTTGPFAACSLNDNTNTNAIQTYYNAANAQYQVLAASSNQVQLLAASSTNIKTAFSYKLNDFAVSFNAGSALTDTSGIVPTVNQLRLGAIASGAAYLNGHLKSIRYYPARVTNAQLQALTSI